MSRFKNLTERLEGRAGASDPERPPVVPDPENPDKPKGEPDPDPETNDEEANMADETPLEEREDYKAGVAAGMKSATDRINTVFAHEDTKGREAHAARLLGRSMSAEDIVAELPNFPAAETLSPDEQRLAAEEGGRTQMKAELDKQGNVDLGAGEANDGKTGRAASDAVWDKANAAVGRTNQKEA